MNTFIEQLKVVNVIRLVTPDSPLYWRIQSSDINRDKKEIHIKNLKRSLLKTNALRLSNIVMDNEFKVIEGQHLVNAARELNLSFPIKVVDKKDYDEKHIVAINTTRKNWDLMDYCDLYVKKGYKSYMGFQNYIETQRITPHVLISMFNKDWKRLGKYTHHFKDGELPWDKTNQDFINEKFYQIRRIYGLATNPIIPDTIYKKQEFNQALICCLEKPRKSYDHDTFIKNIVDTPHNFNIIKSVNDFENEFVRISKNRKHAVCKD